MKRAPIALYALALAVLLAWPLSSAIGSARARPASAAPDVQAVGCVPDGSAQDDADTPALPPGHPPIEGLLPPGHPPLSDAPGLPPGHPPIPSGHPPIPSTTPPFEAPAVLTI